MMDSVPPKSSARLGRGEYMVAEADESDRSFLALWQLVVVVTNIDREHMDFYGSFEESVTAYLKFTERLPFYGVVVACVDHPVVKALIPRIGRKVITYGFSPEAMWTARNVSHDGPREEYELFAANKMEGPIRLNIAGDHNILNSLAAVAVALANHSGFQKEAPDRIKIAGLLHDIGKLVVPAEILQKHQGLTSEDFAIIYKHPYFSAEILSTIEGFDDIGQWVALHHERLDGTGYPYKKLAGEIPEGARILAVADTFTALMEDRPYRCGVSASGSDRIMQNMAAHNKLDKDFVALIYENIEEINDRRYEAQIAADQTHTQFLDDCRLLGNYVETEDKCPVRR